MSYQNISESQIKGYNDCPIVPVVSGTTSPRPRAKRRVSRNITPTSVGSSNENNAVLNSNTLPRRNTAKNEDKKDTSAPAADQPNISKADIDDKIKELLARSSTLPENEFNYYSKKLMLNIDKIDQGYYTFVHQVLTSTAEANTTSASLNQLMIKFMMENSNVSSWCLPLNKILANLR